jgi:hypothetical protein
MATRWTALICAFVVSLTLGLFVLGCASTHTMETQVVAQKPQTEAPATTETAAGPKEGLTVHGHWTIDVRNPDGTLVEHREFENALSIGGGDIFLAEVLGRISTVGGWQIQVFGATQQICEDDLMNPTNCFIVESTNALVEAFNIFKTLTAGVSSATLVLSGSVIAQTDGQITQVSTGNNSCASSVSPDGCPGGPVLTVYPLTSTNLATPVAVLAGQQVQVNVVISFS